MMTANEKLESAFPVRVEFDYNKPFRGAPQHWAIKLLFNTKIEILLPISISLRGSVQNDDAPDTLYLQGWTIDHGLLKCKGRKRKRNDKREGAVRYMQRFYKDSQPIFDKFKLSPVLFISDVEMLFSNTSSWQPRRFSPTWTLYATTLQTKFRHKYPLVPVYGRFMDVGMMIDKVLEKGSHVSFTTNPISPHQVIKLNQFTFNNRASESIVMAEPVLGLANSERLPSVTLQLKDLEGFFRHEDTGSGREYRKKLHNALKSEVKKGFNIVDNNTTCMFYTCPEPPGSSATYYCRYHSGALIKHVLNLSDLCVDPHTALPSERTISLTEDTQKTLQKLSSMYLKPEKTWIMDFEFISMPTAHSPIPLQFAIRQIDGKLLYSGNVEYHLSMEELVKTASTYVPRMHKMTGTIFLRCYGGLNTNGEKPTKIRDYILETLEYDCNEIQLLSWFSAHDMQCFLRILEGDDGLIQERFSHVSASNFQEIHVGGLCKKLYPKLPSTRLQTVHQYLGKGMAAAGGGDYHSAVYDTAAMADIIKVLVGLI